MARPTLAHPGQALGPSSKYVAGPGTHVYGSQIHASLSGPVITTPAPSALPSTSASKMSSASTAHLPTLSIPRSPYSPDTYSPIPSASISSTNTLPAVNSIVLCRVTRLQSRQVTVAILVVGEDACADEFMGVIRREDIRAMEKDKVVVAEGFRVGDLVRGVVISLGDQSNYYLSTARNELGVIMATSEKGNTMYPISWKEFKDPVTGETETRKVAKPF
ncbi:exosome 3'-_5 exonuclease subunit ski4 (Csl4) [Lignoscripta atroalba]|nr:exosome 3'->5 exonuclease subunit ski4 (Csl4) [Lignoscripta atroalba]